MIKERLTNYIYLRRETENQKERLARMKNAAQLPASNTDTSGAQHSRTVNDRMAEATVRYMEYKNEVQPLIDANEAEMASIRAAVNALKNPLEREVLRLRYLDSEDCKHMGWRSIALKIYRNDDEKTMQTVFRLHGRALQNLRKGINAR